MAWNILTKLTYNGVLQSWGKYEILEYFRTGRLP